jgi:hypothetical protein
VSGQASERRNWRAVGHGVVSLGDFLILGLQSFGLVVGINLMLVAATAGKPRCRREKLGYNCRRGSGIKCECEDKSHRA